MVVSVRNALPCLWYCLIQVLLVVHVQAGGEPPEVITRVRNGPGVARGPRRISLPVEDQRDLVGAADVEVVLHDLLEEHPARHRFVEQLGQRELGLQNRQLVAVARSPIRSGEQVAETGPAACAASASICSSPSRSAESAAELPDHRRRRSRCPTR